MTKTAAKESAESCRKRGHNAKVVPIHNKKYPGSRWAVKATWGKVRKTK